MLVARAISAPVSSTTSLSTKPMFLPRCSTLPLATSLPFRTAHHVTGRLVAKAEAKGVDLSGLTLAEMQAEEPGITGEVFAVLSVDASIAMPWWLCCATRAMAGCCGMRAMRRVYWM